MGKHFSSMTTIAVITIGIALNLASTDALAWGPKGHMAVGTIADRLIAGTAAAKQVRNILGTNLRTAAVWADCAKGVETTSFKYGGRGKYPECAVYESPASEKLMEAFVKRNTTNCQASHNTEVCHKQYHYTDVAVQRTAYMRGQVGTTEQDVVAAIAAAISVLRGNGSPAPFNLTSKKEALRVLSHYVGDIHQPLHVTAVYVDAMGQVIDPDQGTFNPQTETRGGNDLLIGSKKLHGEWDNIAGPIAADEPSEATLKKARAITLTSGPISNWSTVWATETLAAAGKDAFRDITYSEEDTHNHYKVKLPQGYNAMKSRIQGEQVVKAGARLAQILMEIWPN